MNVLAHLGASLPRRVPRSGALVTRYRRRVAVRRGGLLPRGVCTMAACSSGAHASTIRGGNSSGITSSSGSSSTGSSSGGGSSGNSGSSSDSDVPHSPFATPSSVRRRIMRVAAGAHGEEVVAESFGDPAGQPVVFLHGGGQNRWTWERTALNVAEAGYWAVTVDMKGHGDSYWDPTSAYASADFGEDLGRFLRASNLASRAPCLVGASLGGLSILMSKPARRAASSVVLVDITPRMEIEGVHRIVSFMHRTAEAGFASLEEASETVARYQNHRKRGPRTPEQLQSLRKVLRRRPDGRWRWHWDPKFISGPKIGLAADGATEDEAMKEHLDRSRDQYIAGAADIRCPCLIMRGRESDLVSADGVRDFLVAVPHAKFVDIADAHHMIAGDSNTVFGAELVSFLDSVYDAEGGAPVPVAGRLQPSRTAAGDSGEARGDRRGSVSDSSDSDSSDSDSDDNGARPFIIRARL